MTIKAQTLADFITEVQNPEPEVTWKVYVDGSPTRQGSGVGVLLVSPHGEWMHLSVRLDYRATNNEVEYEALIAGLQAARHVRASNVLIHSDSQLAAQKLAGAFEIRSVRLKLYAEAFAKLRVSFREVVVQKIPRSANQAADELAKLASSITPIVIEQPVEQVSLVAHIDRMEGLTFPSDWQTAVTEFLKSGITPSDWSKAHLLRRRAGLFALIGDQLYKRAFSKPLLKCVGLEDMDYILKEVSDLVWKKVMPVGDVTKLGAPWAGSFKIVEKLHSGTYYLEDEGGRKLERPWSTNHLQPYRAG
ncbi:uncharacterized protein LOC121997902 [Zingiber officinale]|uniref:uncharacterized protein LOC121997902 n=1 Tax=Zingiber officinale TaxID=94328 RepID=UPI001C4B8BC2|nr:uncharacterized protein LOC121997902 [Zingiber officinale]